MAEAKKYYWLKLKRDFFKRHDIRIIESMPNGKDYILFYLKLLCESVDHEGNLRFSEQIPYNEDMLATITNTNVDVVRSAIKVFTQLEMMEVLDDGTFYMNEVQKMIGSETEWAKKKRIYREQQKALPDKGQTKDKAKTKKDIVSQEIEKEKEKEIEKEKEKKNKTGSAASLEKVLSEFVLDESVKETIREFIKMRKLIKAPMTEKALSLMINKLRDMSLDPDEQIKILNQSIENSWKGIFPLKQSNRNRTASNLDNSYNMMSEWAESEGK